MISVILPFYHSHLTLQKAIKSVVDQTIQPLELLLVSNNADSPSLQIAKEFADTYPWIKLIYEESQGVVFAMNRGMETASAPWIARMDADDEWYPTKLERQLAFLKEFPTTQVIATQVKLKSAKTDSEGFAHYIDWSNGCCTDQDINRNIYVESPLVNPSIIFQTSLIHEYGEYQKGDLPEDYEMFLRWHRHGVIMRKVPEKLMIWYDSADRLTRTDPAYKKEAFDRIKSQYLAEDLATRNWDSKQLWIWGAGKKARKNVHILKNAGLQIHGYIDFKNGLIDNIPCVDYRQLTHSQDIFIVSFVSNRGKGEEIRQYLSKLGYTESSDFIIAG